MEKVKNTMKRMIYYLKGDIKMEKEMEKGKNIIMMVDLKVNTKMEKEMEKEKNIILMVN